MYGYEIRIFTPAHRLERRFVVSLASDFAAMRRAQTAVPEGQGVEVWRDGHCVFADHGGAAAPMTRAAAYEIRILKDGKTPSLIWKSFQTNDTAAVTAALHAAQGRAVEIWRDMDCIFRADAG